MYYPVALGNELTISGIENKPVIAGYVSGAQTIHTFDIKHLQPVYNADSAPVVLRFPRKVIDPGKCVYVDCNNRVCVYSNDQQGTLSHIPISGSWSYIDLPVYPYRREYFIGDHQCAPAFPNNIPPTASVVKPEPTPVMPENPEPYEKSKRKFEYDRYFTYENKIYSFFADDKGGELVTNLCNFAVYPQNIERIVDRNGSVAILLRLMISCGMNSCYIAIQPDKTEKLIKEIQKQIPQAYLNPDEKRASKQLSAYISMMFENNYYANTVRTAGWIALPGYNNLPQYIYANDSTGQSAVFRCETGKRLLWNPGMTQQESFFHAVRMLTLSADMRKTLPLWLVSHMGVMFSLFEQAGFAPRFVTYLYGSSGSLKTSVSKVFFKILKDSFNDIPANFNDTMTALEIKMGSTNDEVLLVDDYRPSAMRTESVRMNGNFERLVRFYGDGIGKGRGNAQLGLRSEFRPHSMCAVTGEYLHGTASSLLRLLIIHVGRKTYDKALLKFYQDNPTVFTTHIKYLTDYIAEKYGEIVQYIQMKFPVYREFFSLSLTESRLIDAAVCMRITADIVLEQYAGQCGLVVPGEISTQLDIWNTVILEAVRESQALASHLEPYDMYLYAMVKSINGKKLTVCDGKQNYQVNGNMAGFIDRTAGYLYIRPQDTYNQVIRYWDLLDRTFSASDRSVRQELAVHQFILTQAEEEKDNTTKVVRLAGNVERRFLVFDLGKLEREYEKIS